MKKISKLQAVSAAFITSLLLLTISPLTASAAGPTITTGTTSSYAVLAAAAITNTGTSTISGTAGGDVGLSPGTSFSGSTTVTMSGTKHITDAAASVAQTDLTTAFNSAAAPAPTVLASAELAGKTLTAGTYSNTGGTLANSGALILDAPRRSNSGLRISNCIDTYNIKCKFYFTCQWRTSM